MNVTDLQARLQQTLPMARMEIESLDRCDDICLALINEDFPTGPLPQQVMNDVVHSPAYWAFCWGAGLAMARYLIDHPNWIADRNVLDIGTGSGIVAIAAKKCGARRVIACDNDPNALAAACYNAAINNVNCDFSGDLNTVSLDVDIVLMADVLYDKSNADLLKTAQKLAPNILVADSRIQKMPVPGYTEIFRTESRTLPTLGEFDEYRTARVFHWSRKQRR